jgi:sensor histidine kinase YesM
VEYQIDPEAFNFDIPPFSMQTLAENAVQHAISVRPEGGSIWITSTCHNGRLVVTVRDDGPGECFADGKSHQFGLRSLRERLSNLFGSAATLTTTSGPNGFEASFELPEHGEYEVPLVDLGPKHE